MREAAIRTATPADAATIHTLICGLAEYVKQPDSVKATPETLGQQMASARPPFECLIAEYAGKPAGFALYFQNYSTWLGVPGLYLEDLFVLPEHRSRGIGKALLVRLARICVERGYGRFEWQVLDWNQRAITFYEQLGAQAISDYKNFRLNGQPLKDLAESVAP